MKFNLSQEMKEILENYTDEVMNAVIDVIEEVGEEAANELHSAGDFKNRTGKYRRGWKSELERQRTFAEARVYNAKHYRLTHLLEFGHAKVNGGRTQAFPHIEVVNEHAQEEAVKKIEKAIEAIK